MKQLLVLAWMTVLLGLVACNTTRGVGEDVEAAGERVQNASKDTEDKLEDEDDEDQRM